MRAAVCASDVVILALGLAGLTRSADSSGVGYHFAHQLEPLRRKLHVQRDHARDIAARPIEAGDKSSFDRVGPGHERR